MSFGLRVRQCPFSESPKALKNWSPSACSSSMFFGATTARTDRPPALFCRSRMAVVLPAPGSATSRCQERLSQESCSFAWSLRAKAVSMNGYFLKGEYLGIGEMTLLLVVFAHRSGFPFTDTASHKRGAIGFPNIFPLDKNIQNTHVSPVIIQVKLTAPQS